MPAPCSSAPRRHAGEKASATLLRPDQTSSSPAKDVHAAKSPNCSFLLMRDAAERRIERSSYSACLFGKSLMKIGRTVESLSARSHGMDGRSYISRDVKQSLGGLCSRAMNETDPRFVSLLAAGRLLTGEIEAAEVIGANSGSGVQAGSWRGLLFDRAAPYAHGGPAPSR